jgi:hypothetical protein
MNTREFNLLKVMSKNGEGVPVWPPVFCKKEKSIDIRNNWELSELKVNMNFKSEPMVSLIVSEKLEPFGNNPYTKYMNFSELRKYAIGKGESERVWQYFDDMRIKVKLTELLVKVDDLTSGRNDRVLSNDYFNSVLSYIKEEDMSKLINKGVAMPALVEKLSDIAKRDGLQEQSNRLLQLSAQLPRRTERTNRQIEMERKELNKVFTKLDDEEVKKLWKELNEKYGISAEYLNRINDGDLKDLYDAYTIRERQTI